MEQNFWDKLGDRDLSRPYGLDIRDNPLNGCLYPCETYGPDGYLYNKEEYDKLMNKPVTSHKEYTKPSTFEPQIPTDFSSVKMEPFEPFSIPTSQIEKVVMEPLDLPEYENNNELTKKKETMVNNTFLSKPNLEKQMLDKLKQYDHDKTIYKIAPWKNSSIASCNEFQFTNLNNNTNNTYSETNMNSNWTYTDLEKKMMERPHTLHCNPCDIIDNTVDSTIDNTFNSTGYRHRDEINFALDGGDSRQQTPYTTYDTYGNVINKNNNNNINPQSINFPIYNSSKSDNSDIINYVNKLESELEKNSDELDNDTNNSNFLLQNPKI